MEPRMMYHDEWVQNFDYQFVRIKKTYRRTRAIRHFITDMSVRLLPTKE